MPDIRWSKRIGVVALALGLCAPGIALAAGDTIQGAASANGPDILLVNDQRVILLGIDAPEANQSCYDGPKTWHCGDTSMAVLDQIAKTGPVTCTLQGGTDPFGRRSGVCTVGGKDVADELVKQGLALAYSHDPESKAYVADQNAAKAAKLGLWADGIKFDDPWVYRMQRNHSPFK